MDIQARLGPLPVWAWGLIFGGAAVAYMYWQNAKDSNGDTVSTDSTDSVDTGDLGSSYDAIDGAFTVGTASGSTLSTTTEETTDTNTAWLARAVNYLIGTGVTPLAAQSALQKYLEGESLSSDETDLVNKAIKSVGQTPEGTSVVSGTGTDSVTIKQWQRLADGSVRTVMSDGSYVARTLDDYIAAGMPKFGLNAYEYQTYKVPSNSTTVAQIASKRGTTQSDLIVLNRWTRVPNLKKGQRIKVPSKR